MSEAIEFLRAELPKFKDREFRVNAQPFFKEPLEHPWMLRGAVFTKISGEAYRRHLRGLPKGEVLDACDAVLSTDLESCRGFAFDWAWRARRHLGPEDFARLERWVKTVVTDWGACDSLCTRALGALLLDHPVLIPRTQKWARSRNLWPRRASAVCLIPSLKAGAALERAFEVADALLEDAEDLVQKGYGWMLKEASVRHPDEVFRFVLERRDVMPRTALRYAIEKMPTPWRAEAMKRSR